MQDSVDNRYSSCWLAYGMLMCGAVKHTRALPYPLCFDAFAIRRWRLDSNRTCARAGHEQTLALCERTCSGSAGPCSCPLCCERCCPVAASCTSLRYIRHTHERVMSQVPRLTTVI